MTKEDKTLELVQRAIAQLKNLPPPFGVNDATSIKEYYAIFDGPARWKAGIRTPQEESVPARKSKLSPKFRERGKSLATAPMN